MHISLAFIRTFFLLLSALFFTTYTTTMFSGGLTPVNLAIGVFGGAFFGILLMGLEFILKQFNLRSFNIAMLGLFFGYLMGEALLLIFNSVLDFSATAVTAETATLIRIGIFLFACYLGMVMTARASDEIYMSVPFIKFKPATQKKKDILLDVSILTDPRIIDLATSGLLDNHLVLPRFAVRELYTMSESADESTRTKARKSLEVVKKLESIPTLEMRYSETDFSEAKDINSKMTRLARHMDAQMITADINRVQQSELEGIRVININFLSNALKPIAVSGEQLQIKIQRYGKEPRQGVGYLEDGTMVVVNGGAEFIGETIKTHVLSVKHTSSGRMIFCNAADEHASDEEIRMPQDEQARSYFTV